MTNELKNLRGIALECAVKISDQNVIERANDYFDWLTSESDVSMMIHEKAVLLFNERILSAVDTGKVLYVPHLNVNVTFSKCK
jgi:hypothetical protein